MPCFAISDFRRAVHACCTKGKLCNIAGRLVNTGSCVFLYVANVYCKMGRMKYRHARVSTDDQNPALQLAALQKAGCKTVLKDDEFQVPRPSARPSSAV